jgi:hypothetical protein
MHVAHTTRPVPTRESRSSASSPACSCARFSFTSPRGVIAACSPSLPENGDAVRLMDGIDANEHAGDEGGESSGIRSRVAGSLYMSRSYSSAGSGGRQVEKQRKDVRAHPVSVNAPTVAWCAVLCGSSGNTHFRRASLDSLSVGGMDTVDNVRLRRCYHDIRWIRRRTVENVLWASEASADCSCRWRASQKCGWRTMPDLDFINVGVTVSLRPSMISDDASRSLARDTIVSSQCE